MFPAKILLQKITNYEGQNLCHFEKYTNIHLLDI